MRSSANSNLVLIGLVAGLASAYGCSSGSNGHPFTPPEAGASGSATAGTSGVAGVAGTSGAAGMAGAAGLAGAPGTIGDDGSNEITKIVPTMGCGTPPAQAIGTAVRGTIQTMGTKPVDCADKTCGAWSYEREYFLTLPAGYDGTKPYPLLFEGPGCGGKGTNLYNNPTLASMVIRVGLTPPPNDIGHTTHPNQGCFDDGDGDASVDWVFYENLYDQLAGQLCFDRNRVFAAGNASGGWLANELGCKYAGDAIRPIRGTMVSLGGWPTAPQHAPTCTGKPMAGFWSHELDNEPNPFAGAIIVMNRVLVANGCTPAGVTYETAAFDPFPTSPTDSTSCKKYQGCPDVYPLVICPFPHHQLTGYDSIINPGWTAFLKMFLL